MKTYRLSSTGDRLTGLCISVIFLCCMVFLLIVIQGDVLPFIICMIACLLVAAGLGFYVVNLFKAACIPGEEGTLLVKGFPDYTIDLSKTVCLETAACKNGPMATRTLRFTGASGEVTAAVPTFFTANQGAQAEPLAMELADALGLTFKPSLEPWEYDKRKRREHQKELAEAEKAAGREKLRLLKAKLLQKAGAGKPTPAVSEEVVSDPDIMEVLESDSINYDALDDEK